MRKDTMLKKIAALGFHGFVRDDSPKVVRVSAEHGDGACTYYGPQGYPVVDARLTKLAKAAGGFWEWENPSNIGFYEI